VERFIAHSSCFMLPHCIGVLLTSQWQTPRHLLRDSTRQQTWMYGALRGDPLLLTREGILAHGNWKLSSDRQSRPPARIRPVMAIHASTVRLLCVESQAIELKLAGHTRGGSGLSCLGDVEATLLNSVTVEGGAHDIFTSAETFTPHSHSKNSIHYAHNLELELERPCDSLVDAMPHSSVYSCARRYNQVRAAKDTQFISGTPPPLGPRKA
jgi:hypothetical protein